MDAAPTKWPAPQIATVLPLLYVQSSQLLGTIGCIRGVPRRDFRAWAICWTCVHPTPFLSTLLQFQLFEGYLFSFVDTPGFVVFSVVIVVVLNFFHPKSNIGKTKVRQDQKLREDACRVFKLFLARFRSCG